MIITIFFIKILTFINIYQSYLNHSYENIDKDPIKSLLIIDHLYRYHNNFKKMEKLSDKQYESIFIENLKNYILVKHYKNSVNYDKLKEIREKLKYLNRLKIGYTTHCEYPKKWIDYNYNKNLDGKIYLENIINFRYGGCFYIKGNFSSKYIAIRSNGKFKVDKNVWKNSVDTYPYLYQRKNKKNFTIKVRGEERIFISIQNMDKKIDIPKNLNNFTKYMLDKFFNKKGELSRLESDYKYITWKIYLSKFNQEKKLEIISKINDEKLKSYLKFLYYQSIQNITLQKDILKKLFKIFPDIFLIIPHYISYFTDQKEIILKDIYKNYKNNLGVLFKYGVFWMEKGEWSYIFPKLLDKFITYPIHRENVINYKTTYLNLDGDKIYRNYYKIFYNDHVFLKEWLKYLNFYPKKFNKKEWLKFENFPHFSSLLAPIYLYKNQSRKAKEILKKAILKKSSLYESYKILKYLEPRKKIDQKLIDKVKKDIDFDSGQQLEYIYKGKTISFNQDIQYSIDIKDIIYFNKKGENFYDCPYIEYEENIFIENILILSKDGKIKNIDNFEILTPFNRDGLYSDLKIKRYYFNAKEGDILYTNYRILSSDVRDYFNKSFGYIDNLISKYSVKNYHLKIETPKNKDIVFYLSNKDLKYSKKKVNNRYIYELKIAQLENDYMEKFSPPYIERGDFIVVSTYKRWKNLSKWFKQLVYNGGNLSKQNIEMIKNMVKKDKIDGKLNIAKYFYNFIISKIRYVGIELGKHSYKPYSPNFILENLYGDCKDRAILYIKILKLFGIKGEFILLRTNDLGKISSKLPPSYIYFNHAIVYLPKYKLFVDLTDSNIPFGELPYSDINSTIFNIENGKIIENISDNKIHRIVTDFKFTPHNSDILVDLEQKREGVFKSFIRGSDFIKDGEIAVENLLHKYYNHPITLKSFKFLNMDKMDSTPIFKAKYLINNYINGDGTSMLKLFNNGDLYRSKYSYLEARLTPFYHPYLFEDVKNFQFEKILKIENFENKKIDTKWFKFKIYRKQNRIYSTFKLLTKYVSIEEYPEFRKNLTKVDKILKKIYQILWDNRSK